MIPMSRPPRTKYPLEDITCQLFDQKNNQHITIVQHPKTKQLYLKILSNDNPLKVHTLWYLI